MKRESGESPEQSRCCELRSKPCRTIRNMSLSEHRWEDGQGWSKSEDLQSH